MHDPASDQLLAFEGLQGETLTMLRPFLRGALPIVTVVLLASLLAEDSRSSEPLSTSLFSFEDSNIPSETSADSAGIELVAGPGVTDGKQAIQVTFRSNSTHSGISFKPDRPWDWSLLGDSGLAFDVANTGAHSTQVYVSVADREGKNGVRTACIPLGDNSETYYLMLGGDALNVDSGLRDDPPAWKIDGKKLIWLWGSKQLDLSRIAKVSIYTETILHDRTLVIDNFRLIHNLETEPTYLTGVCDRFGQNAKTEFPAKVHSEAELEAIAQKELRYLAKSRPMPDRSAFGGWKAGPQLEATGYFRTEKMGNKWALVDPEGYLFFSTGIANARMANTATMTGVDFGKPSLREVDSKELTPEDSKGFVRTSAESRQTQFVASQLRHDMFEWLPEYNDPLEDHYTYVRSVHQGPVKHGEAFSFYQANLERRYGETSPRSYLTKWRDVTVDRMLDWGFTSMGNWTDPSFYQVNKIPYFANGWIIGDYKTLSSGNDYWSPMPDPFDPEFVRRAKVVATAIANEVNDNPWCVGVFVDNEKGWGRMGSFESQYGIVLNALSLDAVESPTKAAMTGILKKKYISIDDLNVAWSTEVESWEVMAKGVNITTNNEAVREDFSELLAAYASEYFRVVDEALDAVMPNHLYMGVRMASWGLTPEVVAAAKKYTDVISYNVYKEGVREEDWDFLRDVDMPSIIGEFHMGTTSDTGLFHPGLIVAADQADRGRMFKEYMASVIDNPYFVGAHWFQYIDSPLTGRSYDGENYNVGFVTIADIPYPEMTAAAKELNSSLYERRYGDVASEIQWSQPEGKVLSNR